MKKLFFIPLLFLFNIALYGQSLDWSHALYSDSFAEGTFIESDTSGNIFVAGSFTDTLDLSFISGTANELISNGGEDIFLLKLNENGQLLWGENYGGVGDDFVVSGKIDQLNQVYLTGSFSQTATFGSGTGSVSFSENGGGDAFILKHDSNGNLLWAKQIGGGFGYVQGNGVDIDANGNIYVVGRFESDIFFPIGLGLTVISASGVDAFITKLDSAGNFLWANQLGGSSLQVANGVVVDQLDAVYVVGRYGGTPDFDFGPATFTIPSNGNTDIFVMQIDSSGGFGWARGMGGDLADVAIAVDIDFSGNVVTTGWFSDTVDFDPTGNGFSLSTISVNSFITKHDSQGNYKWAKALSGNYSRGYGVAIDSCNNVYNVGHFELDVDFDPDSMANSVVNAGPAQSIYISKLDSMGEYITAKHFLSNDYAFGRPRDVNITSIGDVLTTGSFGQTVDFDPDPIDSLNLSSSLGTSAFIHKMTCEPIGSLGVTQNNFTLTAVQSGLQYQWLDCENNFAPISSQTNQSFNPSTNGSYAVKLMNDCFVDTTDCFLVEGLGVEEKKSVNLTIYPNPSDDLIYVQFEETFHEVQLTLSDAKGAVIQIISLNTTDNAVIDLPPASGVYMLVIQVYNELPIYRKIVKR